jgi:hypothetical protein
VREEGNVAIRAVQPYRDGSAWDAHGTGYAVKE